MPTNFDYPPIELQSELCSIVKNVIAPGKGVFAADECPTTMFKRFGNIGVDNTKDIRRQYRQLLFTTHAALAESISSVIMFHETLYQKADDGTRFVELLVKRGIMPGIKADKGVVPLAGTKYEWTTQGLNDLCTRCEHYKRHGCYIANWRCIFRIGESTPSHHAIEDNANVLARFASICQSKGIVPIIEPKVLPEGTYDLERCQKVTETILAAVYKALNDHHVFLEGTLLKPRMVTAGSYCTTKYTAEAIADATVIALRRTVPAAVPGITLSSSGQSEEEASIYLNAITEVTLFKPWVVTFSFTRALQSSVLRAWGGHAENVAAAQHELLMRAKAHSLATQGRYYAGSIPMFEYRSYT